MLSDIEREIKRIKVKLIKKAKRKGLYENFGQKEYRELMDEHGQRFYTNSEIRAALLEFNNWINNYEL